MRVRIVMGDEYVEGLGGAGEDGVREGVIDVPSGPDEKLYELQVTMGNTVKGKARKASYVAIFTADDQ